MISETLRYPMAMIVVLIAAFTAASAIPSYAAQASPSERYLRPPATPLIAVDPYFSVWSTQDFLTDGATTHWTGKEQPLNCLLRVDGKVFRVMGRDPFYTAPMRQTQLQVTPTRSIYRLETDSVRMTLTFTSPCLPDDLETVSRPVSYITWDVQSADGKQHEVALYFEVSALLTVNTPDQKITWNRPDVKGLSVLRLGSQDQPVLGKKGDDLRIDWGYLYVAAPREEAPQTYLGNGDTGRGALLMMNPLPKTDDASVPRPAGESIPTAMFLFELGKVGKKTVSRHLLMAYDDLYSIEFMGQKLRPYWRRNGAEAADILIAAEKDYASLTQRCKAFDEELTADLTASGGRKYAEIASLAYRQCMAAGKLVADANGMPLYFSKECFSNACVATVDVIYPASPQFLLFNPTLLKASLEPVLAYSASPRWKFPFAPHDLGTYPLANGQVYGGGEATEDNQMPVEETGNMLLMMGAVAIAEGNADFAKRHWPVLEHWAEYLKNKGMDPEEQLCTDDFSGHLAHNVNLSAKSTLALAAFASLCEQTGKTELGKTYRTIAQKNADQWIKSAADGDHYRLAFDRPGTWSQKYNLVWNRTLGLNIFPPEVAQKETAYYRKVQKRFGLPLDIREKWTKLDWIFWSASLTGKQADFEALIAPVYDFLNESPSRVPMTDWYWVETGRMALFQARPVVGGVFIRLLSDPKTWKKWSGRAKPVTGEWAPISAAK